MRTPAVAALLLLALLVAAPDAPGRPRLRGRFAAFLPETDVSMYGARAFPGGTVYLCGREGSLARSRDGGKSWDVKEVRPDAVLRVMCWIDENRGIVVARSRGRNTLFLTRDGGNTFSAVTLATEEPVRGLAFLDARNGWLVTGSEKTGDGAWFRTTDGGRTWARPKSVAYGIPGRALLAVTAVGKTRLWAVGGRVKVHLVGRAANSLLYQKKKGSVLHSDDGGRTWDTQDAGNAADVFLTDVEFLDEKVGFVVGSQGFAARTTDGGRTWKKLATGVTAKLRAVDALSPDVAFCVGEKGTALVTSDGGKTFTKLATGTTAAIHDVSFADENHGFAVGSKGTILRFVRDW